MTNTESSQTSQSIEQLVEHGRRLLAPCSDSAKLDAQLLLCLVLDKEVSYLLTWPEKKISEQLINQYFQLLTRREAGEPIAYITGVKEFWSLPFNVSPATLIPRPDTEVLVEKVLEIFADQASIHCLDLGTGTGAIALALASEQANWQIDAVDFSEDAVALAKRNAANLKLPQVNVYQSNWFSEVDKETRFDVIVSNPPYIDNNDVNLSQGDVRFEPKSALVADDHGLADIIHIADVARVYLKKNGKLFIEHGYQQGPAVRNILSKMNYKKVLTFKDLSGHDRVTWANF